MKNITAMSLTNGTLTVVVDNGAQILTARQDHPRWAEIQNAYKNQNNERLLTLLSFQAVVEEYSVGRLSVNATGITYNGNPLHGVDSNRVLAFLRDGLPFRPIANYMERCRHNTSARAITELYSFLEHKNMPLTPEGFIIAYKGVQNDFYSVMGNTSTVVLQGTTDAGGHILNEIGKIIEIERSSCDDNFHNCCSFGIHAGSLEYAKGWGPRVVLVEIDPADVVSVPHDCNCQKLRCCKYKVIGEYTGQMPDTYTSEFSPPSSNKECTCDPSDCDCHDSWCSDCDNSYDDCTCNDPCDCGGNYCPDSGAGIDTGGQAEVPVVTADSEPLLVVDDIVASRVIVVLKEQLGLPWIEPAASLVELGCDELDIAEIIMALETEFCIEIPEDDGDSFGSIEYSVSQLIEYIRGRTVKVNVMKLPTELYQAAVDDGLFGGTSNTVKQDPNYLKGIADGVEDRAKELSPKYIPGDELAADSDAHANYISGYLVAYL